MIGNDIITGNVAIVEDQSTTDLEHTNIDMRKLMKDSEKFMKKLANFHRGTVSCVVVESEPIVEVERISSLFGSWIESGDEDKQLEELYESRLFPSISTSE